MQSVLSRQSSPCSSCQGVKRKTVAWGCLQPVLARAQQHSRAAEQAQPANQAHIGEHSEVVTQEPSQTCHQATSSRRAALWASACGTAGVLMPQPSHAFLALEPGSINSSLSDMASSDLVEGARNLLQIGAEAVQEWREGHLQQPVDGAEADEAGSMLGTTPAEIESRTYTSLYSIMSTHSFFHGLLVGGCAMGLAALNKDGIMATLARFQRKELHPEVASALLRLCQRQDVAAAFHSPATQRALEDIRRDPLAIVKYKRDEEVMAALQKLLEIEKLIEKL